GRYVDLVSVRSASSVRKRRSVGRLAHLDDFESGAGSRADAAKSKNLRCAFAFFAHGDLVGQLALASRVLQDAAQDRDLDGHKGEFFDPRAHVEWGRPLAPIIRGCRTRANPQKIFWG